LTEHYRFVNHVPLLEGAEAMGVNWCEVHITDEQGKTLYHNAKAHGSQAG
jgi:hypothetical protein